MKRSKAALEAIHNRDPDQLAAAFSDVESAARFRDEVLPLQSPEDCRWFWEQTLSPEQFQRIASMVTDVGASVARKQGLTLGSDYSLGVDEAGLGQLLATEMAYSRIAAELPAERRSMLRALLKVLPG